MNLILRNGYPFPFPLNATEDEQVEINEEAQGQRLELKDVVCFEWLHTVTVEFASVEAAKAAQQATGWNRWDSNPLVLEAPTNSGEGYDHPAIIADGKAWCGFLLR